MKVGLCECESSSATNISLLEKEKLVKTRIIQIKDRVGSSFDTKMVSSTVRQFTVSTESLASFNLQLIIFQTPLVGKCFHVEKRREVVERPAGCLIWGVLSHWWKQGKNCRSFFHKTKIYIFNSRQMSTEVIVKQITSYMARVILNLLEINGFLIRGIYIDSYWLNPIIEDGPSHGVGGPLEAYKLYDILFLNFIVILPLKQYSHAWVFNALEAGSKRCSRELFVTDSDGIQIFLKFVLIDNRATLISALEALKKVEFYSSHCLHSLGTLLLGCKW